MSGHYHAIVWIDHREARVFHFNVADVDQLVLHPHNPTRHIHHKANSIGSGHAAEDQAFPTRDRRDRGCGSRARHRTCKRKDGARQAH